MRHFLKIAAVAVAVAGVVSGCGPQDGDKPASDSVASPTLGSASKVQTPTASSTPTPTPKSDGRMVLLDRLSIPKMEGWEYLSVEEGKADTTRSTDAFFDTSGCTREALKTYQCPKILASDTAEALKDAAELGIDNPIKGMSMNAIAAYALCQANPKIAPLKPQGTDNVGGVTAYRYHATLMDCGVNAKSVPLLDPNFKGGWTLWIIRTNKVFITILATDSGAKGMVKYTDIGKLRYALGHAKWVG